MAAQAPQRISAPAVLAALHEAGHAVIAAACGLPMASATARCGRGEVALDRQRAGMMAARYRRRAAEAPPRGALIAAQLMMMGWAMGGACAVELRAADRPRAAWQSHAETYWRMSRGDWRIWHLACARLQGMGVNAGDATPALADWVDATLAQHGATVARLAALLLRRKRLTGPELERLLAPVMADPMPRLRLLAFTARVMDDPALAWPPPSRTLPG